MSGLKAWTEFFVDIDAKAVKIIQLEDLSYWFQFSHLCKLLDYKNPTVALQTHCEDYEIKKLDIGLHEDVNFVSESGFYSLILGSKKPKAREFKKWICTEILPKLRTQGYYATDTATLGDLFNVNSLLLCAIVTDITRSPELHQLIQENMPHLVADTWIEEPRLPKPVVVFEDNSKCWLNNAQVKLAYFFADK